MNNFTCYLCGGTGAIQRQGHARDNAHLVPLECTTCGLVQLSSVSHIDDAFYSDGHMHDALPSEITPEMLLHRNLPTGVAICTYLLRKHSVLALKKQDYEQGNSFNSRDTPWQITCIGWRRESLGVKMCIRNLQIVRQKQHMLNAWQGINSVIP